ncbi:DUF2383 domain-containing protein [Bradyrhizobium sp.]|uniref:DUF2383 domain-containing protein n=1 Tax=Bradyrhizobium sp. TaxID=376 RepID=UPI003C24EEF5
MKSLHTSAIDARNEYQEALKDAAGGEMASVFHDMMTLHDDNAAELASELLKANELPDEDGSVMTMVHKTIMNVRSLFNGLDESVLPGLIDGEKRNVSRYNEALKSPDITTNLVTLLTKQRDGLVQEVARMQAMTAKGERAQ